MSNASKRFLDIIKKANTDTISDLISLTVKSTNPLILTDGDKLNLTQNFLEFDSHIDISNISVGDKFRAIILDGDQVYYITDILSSTNNINKYQGKLTAGSGITITDNNTIYANGGGGGGTYNYNDLYNKPSINSVSLYGNKTSSDLGLQETMTAITDQEIDDCF